MLIICIIIGNGKVKIIKTDILKEQKSIFLEKKEINGQLQLSNMKPTN